MFKKPIVVGLLYCSLGLVLANCAAKPDDSVSETFDDYDIDIGISEANSSGWDLLLDGSDGRIADEQFVSEPNSLHVSTSTDNAIILGYSSGSYQVDFQMYVESIGCYGFLADAPQSAEEVEEEDESVRMFEVYFFLFGGGTVYVDGEEMAHFEFDHEQWMSISHTIDFGNDTAILTIDGEQICEWQYSVPVGAEGNGVLDSIEFFGIHAPSTSYFVDDIDAFKL